MSHIARTQDFEDGIPSYLTRLTQVPLLTSSQEEELTHRVRQGDARARQKLVEANMRLVINIARSYRNKAVPIEDLIQEGAIGLMQAAERFDPERGFQFSTYATHWVRQAIGRAIDNKSKAIRLPAHIAQSMRKIERERMRLLAVHGREPSFDQLADACGMSAEKLKQVVQSSQDLVSLDMSVGEFGGTTLGGLLKDRSSVNPENQVMADETVHALRRVFMELNERERRVIEMRLALDDNSSAAQEEIAVELNLSRERVRQIEVQALKKLRALATERKLKDLLDSIDWGE